LPHDCCSTLGDSATRPCLDRRKTTLLANERSVRHDLLTTLRHDLLTTLLANERTSCSEWRCSIRPESQGGILGQCFICSCLCNGRADSVLSSGPIVLTVPQKLNPGRSRRKSPSATASNLQKLGSSRSVCWNSWHEPNMGRAQCLCACSSRGLVRGERQRPLSASFTQHGASKRTACGRFSSPRMFQLTTCHTKTGSRSSNKNRKSIITHVTCAEAGRGESGPARQHAYVLPSVHCSRERGNVGNSLIVARLRRL